jgi:hypothetical protein
MGIREERRDARMTTTARRMGAGARWVAVAAVVGGCLVLQVPEAHAAPPWVDRHLTLPGGDWAFDFGAGVANGTPPGPPGPVTGFGVNAEMAVGLVSRVELGVRTGLRLGDADQRHEHGDEYGRLFDRQYFDGGDDVVANPEVRVRGALVRDEVFELGLEGRLIVPVAHNDAGALFGVPMMLHLGRRVRLDFGVYVPIIFGNGNPPPPQAPIATNVDVNLPIDVWIQVSPRLWLGPMTGFVFRRVGRDTARLDASLGFGLGYQITHYLDFKTMVLLPYISDPGSGPEFGVGAGVQIRIE